MTGICLVIPDRVPGIQFVSPEFMIFFEEYLYESYQSENLCFLLFSFLSSIFTRDPKPETQDPFLCGEATMHLFIKFFG